MASYAVFVNSLAKLEGDFRELPKAAKLAALRAGNKTLDRTRTRSARSIREQVQYPASYLAPAGGRLTVTERFQERKLEGRITARFRPTSLARFVTSAARPGQAGVRVEVAPGRAKFMRRAFLMRLPQGKSLTDTKFNLGLALRLRPGERVRNKREMVRVAKGLYLLYGPSVSQVFATVAEDESPEAAAFFEAEFRRLLEL